MKYAERPVLYRWSRHEYARLIDHGFLDEDDPIELRDGLRWGYASIETLGADAVIAPLAAPSAATRVADLLP